ncbi:unnamed protein product [Amoebophrya sp. A120]|nr:unnamed protein product [Amoebophrya sp. A120]|eukprot:GSA120T00024757001.1
MKLKYFLQLGAALPSEQHLLADAAACSATCANEFRTGCFKHQCTIMGKTTAAAINACRHELDNQIGPIANRCPGEVGCTLTTSDLDCSTQVGPSAAAQAAHAARCKTATPTTPDAYSASSFGATIRIVGDSCLSGDGVQAGLAETLQTTVTNCAKGGAKLSEIYSLQTACSSDSNCPKWSIVGGGRNGVGTSADFGATPAPTTTLEAMRILVNRETAAGRKVVLFLYPPDQATVDPASAINTFQNEFKEDLVNNSTVFVYDPRLDTRFDFLDPNSRQYRATDNSHPSELARTEMGKALGALIQQWTSAAGSSSSSSSSGTGTATGTGTTGSTAGTGTTGTTGATTTGSGTTGTGTTSGNNPGQQQENGAITVSNAEKASGGRGPFWSKILFLAGGSWWHARRANQGNLRGGAGRGGRRGRND